MLFARSIILAAVVTLGCSVPPPLDSHELGDEWPSHTNAFREVMRDDFDGAQGSAPNAALWNVEEREFGHNSEQDYNTKDRENSYLDGQGRLVIAALEENHVKPDGVASSQPYTSARLTTTGKLEQQYGRIEMRAKLPSGKGLWPAFWLLGTSIDAVGWPECGEIDVVELRGSRPRQIAGSMHGPDYSYDSPYTRSYELEAGSFADDFHTFTIEWTPEGVRWLVDGAMYHSRTAEGARNREHEWVFDRPMYVILNLAVGGMYDGSPDASTVFPAQLLVDYVSVSSYEP